MINNENPILANDSNTKFYQFTITGGTEGKNNVTLVDITDNAIEPCNIATCYNNSLPGLIVHPTRLTLVVLWEI